MKLHSPFIITSKLLPGLQVGGATIHGEITGREPSGRTRYKFTFDLPRCRKEHVVDDLSSGCQGEGLQEGFESLLAFLVACAESRRYDRHRNCRERGENSTLFNNTIGKWAEENSDEISMLQCELEENKNLIEP